MKLRKLFHLLALMALVACAPTLGPSFSTPTTAPRPVAALATVTAAPVVIDTVTVPSPAPPSPTTVQAAATAARALGQPQWGNRTKTTGCLVQGLFPDPACTPGDIFPNVTAAQVCVSGYSSSVRNVPASEKDAVYAEYGITSHATGQYEVDHFVSLELGGSNDISNLFPEAASPTPGFHQKDQVENYLHSQVCNGAVSLAEAQREIANNWLAVYTSMSGGSAPATTPAPAQNTATQAQQVVPTATGAPAATAAPTQAAARARVGALCNDGTSSTATGSGACSKHKGVQCWKYSDGTCTNP
jgi:hypothetical protein